MYAGERAKSHKLYGYVHTLDRGTPLRVLGLASHAAAHPASVRNRTMPSSLLSESYTTEGFWGDTTVSASTFTCALFVLKDARRARYLKMQQGSPESVSANYFGRFAAAVRSRSADK